jgi:hypothetical protein
LHRFFARRFQELDAGGQHRRVVAVEVVGVEEEGDAATGLVADAAALFLVAGAGQQQGGGAAVGRADHHPALVPWSMSSSSAKPSLPVYQAMASS